MLHHSQWLLRCEHPNSQWQIDGYKDEYDVYFHSNSPYISIYNFESNNLKITLKIDWNERGGGQTLFWKYMSIQKLIDGGGDGNLRYMK